MSISLRLSDSEADAVAMVFNARSVTKRLRLDSSLLARRRCWFQAEANDELLVYLPTRQVYLNATSLLQTRVQVKCT